MHNEPAAAWSIRDVDVAFMRRQFSVASSATASAGSTSQPGSWAVHQNERRQQTNAIKSRYRWEHARAPPKRIDDACKKGKRATQPTGYYRIYILLSGMHDASTTDQRRKLPMKVMVSIKEAKKLQYTFTYTFLGKFKQPSKNRIY